MGRPGIDPEAALRLMLAGYFQGIVHDRKLIREAQVNLAIRWFAGFRLHENLPEHSSLTKIRQRWPAKRFEKIFQKTVQMCIDAGDPASAIGLEPEPNGGIINIGAYGGTTQASKSP